MARHSEPRPRSLDWGQRWRTDRLRTDQVIWAIIAVNVVVFIGWQDPSLRGFMYDHFTVSIESVLSLRIWTLLTAELSHYDTWHLVFNMWGLYLFGRTIGQARGAMEVLQIFLTGATLASVAHVAFSLGLGTSAPAIGASGGVMALAAYYGGMFPDRTLLLFFVVPVPAALAVALFILADVFGLLWPGSPVAHAAHLGGAAYGLLHYQLFVQGPQNRR